MSTEISLYQLRRQKARYELPEEQERKMVFLCLPLLPVLPRDLSRLFVVLVACVIVLFCMLWYACDLAVDLAQQAYGVVI